MKNKRKTSILTIPLFLIFIPTIILSFVFSFVSTRNIYVGNMESKKSELQTACYFFLEDYYENGESPNYRDHLLFFSESTGNEYSIIIGKDVVLTTIENADLANNKQTINDTIYSNVILNNSEYFLPRLLMEGKEYCCYYMPIIKDNAVIGCVFAGRTLEFMDAQMRSIIILINAGAWSTTIAAAVIAWVILGKMKKDLGSAVTYLHGISDGILNNDIDEKLLTRRDEIGDVGKSAKTMKESIETLINYDMLTGLLNRRACQECMSKHKDEANSFYVALGDLDGFKKVNDTYGHLKGDEVLKSVSKVFKELTDGKGVASRWGGEEFVFAFYDMEESEIVDLLNEIIARVRIIKFESCGEAFNITISIGLEKYTDSIDKVILGADRKMYKAKDRGGDTLVK